MEPADLVLLASELTEKGARTARALDDAAAVALGTGSAPSRNPKDWVNEDSLALHRLEDGALLACVADSHFGGYAGEAVARHLKRAFAEAPGAAALERLLGALRGVDARLHRDKPEDDPSETTALLVHLAGRVVSFVSVGDSYLFAVGLDGCRPMNPPSGRYPLPFLGGVPTTALPEGAQPDCGAFTLRPGQALLLASDGIEPDFSGLGPQDVVRHLYGDGPLRDRLEGLQAAADDPERGGGKDNLALVAVEV